MNAAEIVAALAKHDTKIAVDGQRVRLVFGPGNAPPDDLIQAAREAKTELLNFMAAMMAPTAGNGRDCRLNGPEPIGRWMLLVQRWGASINDASKLVTILCAAAGPLGATRRAHVGELFAKMEGRHRWSGRRKIQWLKWLTGKMQDDPMYWPAERPDQAAAGRDGPEMILRALRRAPKRRMTKAEMERATGMTGNTISNLVLSMKKAGEIIPIRPGLYALPQSGAARHVPACELIITALWTTPNHQAAIIELVATTGVSRNAIYSAASRMIARGKKKGLLVSAGRGVYALSPDTLRKIERGERIRIGHNELIPDLRPVRTTPTSRPA